MGENKRILLLAMIMAAVAAIVAGVAMLLLYEASFKEAEKRLRETAQSHARLIESVARFDRKHYLADAKTVELDTIASIREGLAPLFGSVEVTVARRAGDRIVFLLRQRAARRFEPAPVDFNSSTAEPMRRALLGGSGTLVGLDYRNVTVLAAHEPVAVLDLGIVVKMDLAEVRAPFFRAGLIVMVIALVVILFGVALFLRLGEPMVRRLRVSEEKFRTLVQSQSELICQFLPDSALLFANDAYCRFFGKSLDELVGCKFINFIPEDRREKAIAHLAAFTPDRPTDTQEHEVIGAEGEARYFHWANSAMFDGAGRPTMFFSIGHDITERKQTEEALCESEERLATAQRIAKLGHWVWDEIEDRQIYTSRMAEDIFGRQLAGILPDIDEFLGYVHPDDRERVRIFLEQAREARTGYQLEYRIVHPDGEIRFVEEQAEFEFDDDGKSVRSLGTVLDITERKRSERALKDSEDRLRASQGVARLGHYSLDIETGYWTNSDQLNEIFGIDEHYQRNVEGWLKIVHPDFKEILSNYLQDNVFTQHQKFDKEYKIINIKTKQEEWVHGLGHLIFDDEKNPIEMFGTIQDITERKRTEAALVESEARFRHYTETSSDYFWEMDENLRFSKLAERFTEFTGLPAEELLGKTREETGIPGIDPEIWRAHLADLAAHRPIVDFIHSRILPNGKTVWLSINGLPVFDDSENFKGYRGTGKDITERKRAEEALAESEVRFRHYTETSSDFFWEMDENLRFSKLSERWSKLASLPAEELLGKTREETGIPGIDPEIWRAHLADLAAHRPFVDFIHPRTHPDGNTVWLSINGLPVFDDSGNFKGYRGTGKDITDRVRAETALRDSEAKFRGMSAAAHDATIVMDDEGSVMFWNEAAERMFGYTQEEALGAELHALITPAHYRKAFEKGFRRFVKTGEGALIGATSEIDGLRKDGKTIPLEISLSAFMEKGRWTAVGSIRDLTERKKAEQELRNAVYQRQAVLFQTVEAVARTVEARDPYTAGHERRVAELADAIARDMDLPEDRRQGLRLAATIHDIGKLQVPMDILNRPGRLSQAEFEIVKSHSQVGYDILKDIEFPWPVANIVLQHHERMDGSGYPEGLKGDDILLESKILGVADMVEAMASHRPYRAEIGIDDALLELENGKGGRYDPDVADCCLRLFKEKGYELPPRGDP